MNSSTKNQKDLQHLSDPFSTVIFHKYQSALHTLRTEINGNLEMGEVLKSEFERLKRVELQMSQAKHSLIQLTQSKQAHRNRLLGIY
jgi:gamma-glutamylcysteine synthetase